MRTMRVYIDEPLGFKGLGLSFRGLTAGASTVTDTLVPHSECSWDVPSARAHSGVGPRKEKDVTAKMSVKPPFLWSCCPIRCRILVFVWCLQFKGTGRKFVLLPVSSCCWWGV